MRTGLWLLLAAAPCARAQILAADNADNEPYLSAQAFNPGDNGGTNFMPWLLLNQEAVGAMFLEELNPLDGNQSWGLSGGMAVGRPLTIAELSGSWTFLARHDAANTGFSGFNLKTSNSTGFETDEVLRFGVDPSQAGYDGTGFYVSTNRGADYLLVDAGFTDLAGDLLQYSVAWNAAGAFSVLVSNRTEQLAATYHGSWGAPAPVRALGASVMGVSNDEKLVFDDYRAVPEPAALSLLCIVAGGLLWRRRWRR